MAVIGWPDLILILSFLFLIVPILIVYYIIKYVARKAVKEALEKKVPPLQVTTRICPQCQRGVTEEAKFCPKCGKSYSRTKRTNRIAKWLL